jgi:hypothetical protein
MVKCIDVEMLSRVYALRNVNKKLGVALIGLNPPTLVVLGKGFYMCREVDDLKKLIESIHDACLNVVYIARGIDEEWLKKNLPLARHGDDIVGDGVITTFRVEPKRFSIKKTCIGKEVLLYALDEVLRKLRAEPLIQVIKTHGVQEPSTFSYSS